MALDHSCRSGTAKLLRQAGTTVLDLGCAARAFGGNNGEPRSSTPCSSLSAPARPMAQPIRGTGGGDWLRGNTVVKMADGMWIHCFARVGGTVTMRSLERTGEPRISDCTGPTCIARGQLGAQERCWDSRAKHNRLNELGADGHLLNGCSFVRARLATF